VPDPRSPRGLRQSLLSILLITVCALVAGKNGYTAIEAWAKEAPAHVLHALDVRFEVIAARYVCPDESTIRDVISQVDRGKLVDGGLRLPAGTA
jgi:DDE_Tnp_1-associated